MTTYNELGTIVGSGQLRSLPLPADWLDHLGWFRFYLDGDRWTWSPQIERMHGYQPGTTAPSTLLLLSHVDLADYERVESTLRGARRTRQPFSSRHRIIDTSDQLHDVVLIGAPFHDARGAVVGMNGLYLDLSQAAAQAHSRRYEHTTNQLRIAATGDGPDGTGRHRIRAATRC